MSVGSSTADLYFGSSSNPTKRATFVLRNGVVRMCLECVVYARLFKNFPYMGCCHTGSGFVRMEIYVASTDTDI
jgi:hypothetical protein